MSFDSATATRSRCSRNHTPQVGANGHTSLSVLFQLHLDRVAAAPSKLPPMCTFSPFEQYMTLGNVIHAGICQ